MLHRLLQLLESLWSWALVAQSVLIQIDTDEQQTWALILALRWLAWDFMPLELWRQRSLMGCERKTQAETGENAQPQSVLLLCQLWKDKNDIPKLDYILSMLMTGNSWNADFFCQAHSSSHCSAQTGLRNTLNISCMCSGLVCKFCQGTDSQSSHSPRLVSQSQTQQR